MTRGERDDAAAAGSAPGSVDASNDRDSIERLVRDYIALSKGMQFEAKRGFWDVDEPHPVLAPEEAAAPLVGWDAIERYWGASSGAMKDLATDCFDVHVNLLSSDLALAVFRQRWVATMAGPDYLAGAPLASTVRATFVLRRCAGAWKICTSVEAHVDGVTYFRELYEARAATRS
jgi:ketosteroid isomerase-like protein